MPAVTSRRGDTVRVVTSRGPSLSARLRDQVENARAPTPAGTPEKEPLINGRPASQVRKFVAGMDPDDTQSTSGSPERETGTAAAGKKPDAKDATDAAAKRPQDMSLEERKAALPVPPEVLNEFTPQELDEVKDLFVEVDLDGSGAVDENELAVMFQGLDEEVTQAQLKELIAELDQDGSGSIEFPEFLGMILSLRRGEGRLKGFAKLLQNVAVTPVAVLAQQAKARQLDVAYQVLEIRAATSLHPTTYIMEAVLTGEWIEYVNGGLRRAVESRRFQGIGVSTRQARAKAATKALSKLKEYVPGLQVAEGEIPDAWMRWAEQNLDLGVDPNIILSVVRAKGFHPTKNLLLMNLVVAHSKLERVVDASASQVTAGETATAAAVRTMGRLDEARVLPPAWNSWVQAMTQIGVDTRLVLDLLIKHGLKPHNNPGLYQALANGKPDSVTARAMASAPAPPHSPSSALSPHKTLVKPQQRDMAFFEGVGFSAFKDMVNAKEFVADHGTGAEFWGAAERGDTEVVRFYLSGGQNPNQTGAKRMSALHLAAANNRIATADLLIDKGAAINQADNYGRTAMHHACIAGHLGMVERLILHGAHIFIKDKYGEYAIHCAAAQGHHEVCKWLVVYCSERLRRVSVAPETHDVMRHCYDQLLLERLSQYQTQIFPKSWLCDGAVRFYKSCPPTIQAFIPEPYEEVAEVTRNRYMTIAAAPDISSDEFVMLCRRLLQESLIHVRNKMGRTPMHLAADPPFATIAAGHEKTLICFADEFGADTDQKDTFHCNPITNLQRRDPSLATSFGHALDASAAGAERPSLAPQLEQRAQRVGDDPAAQLAALNRSRFTLPPHETADTESQRKFIKTITSKLRRAAARLYSGDLLCEWGCRTWVAPGERSEHEQMRCVRRVQPCKLGCGLQLRIEQWQLFQEEHLRDECPKRPLPCVLNCGMTILAEAMRRHIEDDCVKRPMPPTPCRLKCGFIFAGKMESYEAVMEDMAEHENENCPMRQVRCDFEGCMATMHAKQRRTHRAAHLQDMGIFLFSTPGTYVWEVPAHIRQIKVQLWGGGGGAGQLQGIRGAHGGGAGYVETILEVFGREKLTLVVGFGGSHGVFGVSTVPANAVLQREAIHGSLGRAAGGIPGGGEGRGGNSSWAAGGGGGFSALYRVGPFGQETLAIAAGGGGGGSRCGHPGGRAWFTPTGPEGEEQIVGGVLDDEVPETELEVEEIKAAGLAQVERLLAAQAVPLISDAALPALAVPEGSPAATAGVGAGVPADTADEDKSDSDAETVYSSNSDSDDDATLAMRRRRRAVAKAAARRKLPGFGVAGGELAPDGDDLLRCGRDAGPTRGGRGGYGGGWPGKALQGGAGADFGGGGGGGLYGGGGGGFTPGLVGGGGGGSSFAVASAGFVPVFLPGDGRMPGGVDRDIAPATGAGLWDLVGGNTGEGGRGGAKLLEDGKGGAIRIRLPGYYDSPQSDMGKGIVPV